MKNAMKNNVRVSDSSCHVRTAWSLARPLSRAVGASEHILIEIAAGTHSHHGAECSTQTGLHA